MKRKALVPAVVAALLGAGPVFQLTRQGQVRCRVCVTYEGQRQCANARGDDRASAEHEALSSACSVIAHGVSDAFACPRTKPDEVACTNE